MCTFDLETELSRFLKELLLAQVTSLRVDSVLLQSILWVHPSQLEDNTAQHNAARLTSMTPVSSSFWRIHRERTSWWTGNMRKVPGSNFYSLFWQTSHGFSQFLQANAGMIHSNRPHIHLSTSLATNHSWSVSRIIRRYMICTVVETSIQNLSLKHQHSTRSLNST